MINSENVEYVFDVGAAIDTVQSFADLIGEEVDRLAPADLVAPHYDEYRLKAETGGSILLSVDLRIAPGVYLPVQARLTKGEGVHALEYIREGVRHLLGSVFDKMDALQQLRTDVERKGRRLMAAANRRGLAARLLSVDFAPVSLRPRVGDLRVRVVVEGATCNMLRPYREIYEVNDVAGLARVFKSLEAELKPVRRARRAEADAVGAIGFIDSVALAIVDRLPEGREAVLRQIARNFEHTAWLDMGAERPQAHGLKWYDGVVRAYAPLTSECHREWDRLDVGSTSHGVVGQLASTLCSHPALDGLIVEQVLDEGEVRVTDRLSPFTVEGVVLGTS